MFESKINRGRANGYAPLDGSGKVPLDKLPPIQSTIDTGSFATTGSNIFIGEQTISTIQGTGSLYLKPNSEDSRHFEIYNTNPNDTHIKSNGGLSYFGDDTNYLKIDDSAGDVTIAAFSDIILTADDGGVYIGSYGSGNGVVTNGYLNTIIGDTDIINGGTGNSITDVIGRISTISDGTISSSAQITELGFISSSQTIDTGSFATTGSNTFNGNQTINGPLTINVSTGTPIGVSNWNGQGGWNQGFYSNITASGGTGTGLTVDVAAGGGGYINIGAISINNPGSGYTDGDVVTIDNENNLPGQFTIEVSSTTVLQCDVNGNLILDVSSAPTNLTGSVGDIKGTLKIDDNSIYFATQSFVAETYQIVVNNGTSYNTHVSIPKNQGIPSLYSGGWSITTSGNTTYVLTGVYSDGDNWDCEIDNLNSNYSGGTQTMTLTWLDYVATDIWKKIDFGFEKNKFVENTFTSSFVTTSSFNEFTSSLNNAIELTGSTVSFLGNIVIYGTQSVINSQNVEISDNILYLSPTASTDNDLGIVGHYNDGTYRHAGIFMDASDGHSWKVFNGLQTETTATVDTNGTGFTLAPFKAGAITGTSFNGTVNATNGIISGSSQLPAGLVSGSSQVLGGSGVVSGSYETTGRSIISSSAQITSLGFVSGSYLTNLSGAISSSSQLTSSFDSRYTLSGSISSVPAGTISGSAQITALGFVSSSTTINTGSFVTTSSFNAFTASALTTGSNTFSGSQIISGALYVTSITSISSSFSLPSGSSLMILSGSNIYVDSSGSITGSLSGSIFGIGDVVAFSSSVNSRLNSAGGVAGTISGSAQITAFGFVSGSYETTGRSIVSGSSQLTSSYDTRYILSGSVSAVPDGTISGSSQLTSSYDTRYLVTGSVTSSISQLNTFTASISTASLVASINNLNTYTASQSTASLVTSITNINSFTSSLNVWSSSVATTGSNSFNGNQTITGSLNVSSMAVVSSSFTTNSSSLYLTSGSNLYVQNNGVVEITGSLVASGSTISLITPVLQIGTGSGDEGGEILLAKSQTNNSLTGSGITIDSYQNKIRIFEQGGNARGVSIDLSKTPNGVGGELLWKAGGLVNADVDVTLGNLKARIPSTGNRSLQLSTVSGTYSVYGSGVYSFSGLAGTTIASGSPLSITTTPAYIIPSYNFTVAGAVDTWTLMDTSAGIAWRITMIIGASYNNNMISIERLV
jgi:hypothetical protein